MHWLIVVLLVLFLLAVGGLIVLWVTHGFLAVLGGLVGLYLAMWVLSKILPVASRSIFQGMFDRLAGPMKDARVEVLSVRLGDETARLEEELREMETWLEELIEEEGRDRLVFDASEAFHEEGYPSAMQETYIVELTITPPEPDTAWTPHGLGLRAVAEPTAGGAEIVEFRLSSGPDEELAPFDPQEAFEEITGKRRVELTTRLDADYSEYAIEYLHADHWDTVITLPPAPAERYVRRLTAGVIERLTGYPDLTAVALSGMPLIDDDIPQLAGLPRLECLDLSFSGVTDACIPLLQQAQALKTLAIQGTKISTSGAEQLRTALPEAKVHDDLVNPFG